MKFDKRTTENIHKLVLMIREYPDKKLTDIDQYGNENGIAGLYQTSPIEFNAAAWGAVDEGFIKINDDNSVELLKEPKEYVFSELTEHLMEIIPYTIGKINEKEADIEDEYFGGWTAGYPPQDLIAAVTTLIAEGKLAKYDIVDVDIIKFNREERRKRKDGKTEERVENTYTFYTLPENVEKRWGEKQFKDAKKLQQEQSQAK